MFPPPYTLFLGGKLSLGLSRRNLCMLLLTFIITVLGISCSVAKKNSYLLINKEYPTMNARINSQNTLTLSDEQNLESIKQMQDLRVNDMHTGKTYSVSIEKERKNMLSLSVEGNPFAMQDINHHFVLSTGDEKITDIEVGSRFFDLPEFHNAYFYNGNDLGAVYTPEKTTFKVWAPTASEVSVALYKEGDGENLYGTYQMIPKEKGVWEFSAKGDLNTTYYTYFVSVAGQEKEAVDPYAKAVGVNGNRGMVVDLSKTNPPAFETSNHVTVANQTDAIIYELHVRDFSISNESGIRDENKGKYLAFTEQGTKNSQGLSTGLDHIKELGVNYIHLLPIYDFASLDETKLEQPQFNWGYDPKNYNAPDGSYSTDPYHGEVRIKEMKEMVSAIHNQGIGVIMDVVYNHTFDNHSSFQTIVPNYYYGFNLDGSFANGSGCGNETASYRSMYRKFMVDSLVFWANEYKIDGFRFDLMGLHDVATMNEIRKELDKINPKILMYGEPWQASAATNATLDSYGNEVFMATKYNRSNQSNVSLLDNRIAVFNDDFRNAVRGDGTPSNGFCTGAYHNPKKLKASIMANVLEYDGFLPWANAPTQVVSYASAHDDHTLFDQIKQTNPTANEETILSMYKSTALNTLLSQGLSFIHAGEELLRYKHNEDGSINHNSYQSSDFVNQLKWNEKEANRNVFEYYKGLIAIKKNYPHIGLTTTKEIAESFRYFDTPNGTIGYVILKDDIPMVVLINGTPENQTIAVPADLLAGKTKLNVIANGETAGTTTIATITNLNEIVLTPHTANVLVGS